MKKTKKHFFYLYLEEAISKPFRIQCIFKTWIQNECIFRAIKLRTTRKALTIYKSDKFNKFLSTELRSFKRDILAQL